MINFNSIGLIPLESFYGSEIKLNGGTGKNARSLSATIENQPTVKKEKNWRKTRINREKRRKLEKNKNKLWKRGKTGEKQE